MQSEAVACESNGGWLANGSNYHASHVDLGGRDAAASWVAGRSETIELHAPGHPPPSQHSNV